MPVSSVLSSEEMAKADSAAITSGVSAATLMENAGRAVAEEIALRYGPRKTLVLAGPGNNGGDGYVVARLLSTQGFDVTVAAMAPAAKGAAAEMEKKFKGTVVPLTTEVLSEKPALVVDALFGLGLSKSLEGVVAELAEQLAASDIPVVAVDIPSGVDGTSGVVRGIAMKAELTVTFECKKRAHVLLPGKAFSGEVVVRPIGISETAIASLQGAVLENTPALWLARFPWPKMEGHKYHRGYATIVGGDAASTGASRLSAISALRVGAGLVALACPPAATPAYAAGLTSVMVKPIKDVKSFELFLEEPHRDAVLVGPGNGVNSRTRNFALSALKRHKKLVLDADALTVFEAMPEHLFAAIKASAAPVVLTPHHAEFRRVFDTLIQGSKIDLAKKAAKLSSATVLLKGNDTVIAAPDGRVAVNTNAPATLATAGTGDVLAGLVLGLLAMGMDGFDAACAAAWIHGEAARRFGFGLIAEDLPAMIPAVLTALVDETAHETPSVAADASC